MSRLGWSRPGWLRRGYLPAALWAALIFASSSVDWGPKPWQRDVGLLGQALLWLLSQLPASVAPDKAIHAVVFATLAALLRLPSRLAGWQGGAVAWAGTVAWGAIDEAHQSMVPGRDADVFDLLADTVGGIVGVALAALWLSLRRRRLADAGARGA